MTNSTPLSSILENKRLEVRAREAVLPLAELEPLLTPSERQYTGGFILECKKASPSQGVIRPDFDIEKIVKIYAPFANAISVLTDKQFFQGDLSFLTQVSNSVSCPVLCKDFIISPYQVYEARLYQADMILLMLSVLDDATYQACAEAAKILNLEILTEIHNELELKRALNLGAKMIGVNNRDFKTLQVNLEASHQLLPKIPKDILQIVESGIETHADILEFKNQADGFLIGTSLMREERLDIAVREILFGRIKICGLTSVQDAQIAYEAGASFGGLIFASESPRCVNLKTGLKISNQVNLKWVGVFVNAPIQQVCEYARDLKLFAVQLHGEESEGYVSELRSKLAIGVEIWCASDFGDKHLLDTPHENLRGGTGKSFDWSTIPKDIPKEKIILSGGLGAHNIAQADQLGYWALDVNSQVEQAPGLKSEAKIRELFAVLARKYP